MMQLVTLGFVIAHVLHLSPAAAGIEDVININATRITPGGRLLVRPLSHLYGNDVTLRNQYIPSGARKSWIDPATSLPSGYLRNFYINVHNFTNENETTSVRLQIWRPSPEIGEYNLVWQRRVTVSLGHAVGALYEFGLDTDDVFNTNYGDIIGWTTEDNVSPISFTYEEGHRTYFRDLYDSFPAVGLISYAFSTLALPAVCSVAVQVVPLTALGLECPADTTVLYNTMSNRRLSGATANETETFSGGPLDSYICARFCVLYHVFTCKSCDFNPTELTCCMYAVDRSDGHTSLVAAEGWFHNDGLHCSSLTATPAEVTTSLSTTSDCRFNICPTQAACEMSECTLMSTRGNTPRDVCHQAACSNGANVLNYSPSNRTCEFRTCLGGSLMLTHCELDWNVYVLYNYTQCSLGDTESSLPVWAFSVIALVAAGIIAIGVTGLLVAKQRKRRTMDSKQKAARDTRTRDGDTVTDDVTDLKESRFSVYDVIPDDENTEDDYDVIPDDENTGGDYDVIPNDGIKRAVSDAIVDAGTQGGVCDLISNGVRSEVQDDGSYLIPLKTRGGAQGESRTPGSEEHVGLSLGVYLHSPLRNMPRKQP